ncbi:LysR family transcriptional regulator [Luteimicrobium sp. NPDC057192]|uniref:LysR family transcriptional regulator n=1 Tax=Luteimicrobium sp. NPDC057192 TaxID=3346042 RepID=UPI0036311A44
MLDPRRLRLLRDLARLGTIAAVAGLRGYTASAVSQQLSALEREAGAPLLERTGRRVRLTAAGEALAASSDDVLEALERAEAAVAATRDAATGRLRIGAFPTAVRTLLPDALVRLGERHPGLELHVVELDPADVPAALREDRVDVGLVQDYDVAPGRGVPGVASVPLCVERVYLASHGPGRGVDDVRDQPWILAGPGTLCRAVAEHLCAAAGYEPRERHVVDDFTTVLALVAAGQGVAIVPQLAATSVPAGVRLDPVGTTRRTRVAHRAGADRRPEVRAFTRALRESAVATLGAA